MAEHTTVYIDEETKQLIAAYNVNVSEFLRQELKSHYSGIDGLRLKEEELKTQLARVQKNIKVLQIYTTQDNNSTNLQIDEREQDFWNRTIELFENSMERATKLQGRTALYNNEFNKKLTPSDFLVLYSEIKNKEMIQ